MTLNEFIHGSIHLADKLVHDITHGQATAIVNLGQAHLSGSHRGIHLALVNI